MNRIALSNVNVPVFNNYQILNEAELDMKNSAGLYIPRTPNSIIALSFIQNIFKLLKQKMSFTFNNFAPSNNTISCPVFSVISSIICSGLHFLLHWFNMTEPLSIFGEQQLVMVNSACGFSQSETGKHFEWIIKIILIAASTKYLE